MREINLPQSEAKRRLLDAAEQLFAERGFEAVSVRDITQLRKPTSRRSTTTSAPARLGRLVVTRYLTPVNEERLARLDALERKAPGKALPVEEIIDAFVRPLVGIVRKSELSERLSCKLLGRIFAMQGEGLPGRWRTRRANERTFHPRAGQGLAIGRAGGIGVAHVTLWWGR